MKNLRVAAIASMKQGLEHFVYGELMFLHAQGFAISLFPTKYHSGLYDPKDDWGVHYWKPWAIALSNVVGFLRAPLLYLRLLAEALSTRSLIDVLFAWDFVRAMDHADVIYATFGDHKLFIGYYCKRIIARPLVVKIHAYELYHNPNPGMFLRALSACDEITTVTEYNREYLADHFGIDPSAVHVVRLSIDTKQYRPEIKFVILIVGFFVERKGHSVLFQAVKALGRPDIEIWVVGDIGPDNFPTDVRALAAEIGVDGQVAFFGKQSGNALRALYRSCDVFCLPCHTDSRGGKEGFPTVLMEAMAMGKPVITTRHVEIPRIVDEILVDENDVQGLAQAIERTYQSVHLRQRLGEKGRRIAEQVFSPRNAERMAALLSGAAERQDTRVPQPHSMRREA